MDAPPPACLCALDLPWSGFPAHSRAYSPLPDPDGILTGVPWMSCRAGQARDGMPKLWWLVSGDTARFPYAVCELYLVRPGGEQAGGVKRSGRLLERERVNIESG